MRRRPGVEVQPHARRYDPHASQATDNKALEREDVLAHHVSRVFQKIKAKPFTPIEKFIQCCARPGSPPAGEN